MEKKKTNIFVVSGPGGVGKTTLVELLFKKKDVKKKLIRGITVTTRAKREQEEEGRDYFFVREDEFIYLEKRKFFLESQKVLGHYYGTPKMFYLLAKKKNKDLVLCIDVQGGMYLKKNFKNGKITTIFIAAPNKKELRLRMSKRLEEEQIINKRVALSGKEAKIGKQYDHLIVNKNIENAFKRVEKIILGKEINTLAKEK